MTGAELTLARALVRVDEPEELWFDLVLRPATAPRRRPPIWDLRPVPVPVRSDERPARARDDARVGVLECSIGVRAHARTPRRAESLVRELEPVVHLLGAGSCLDLGGARRSSGSYRPRLGGNGEALSLSELARLFPLAAVAQAVAESTRHATVGERLLGVRRVARSEIDVRLSVRGSREHLHVLGPTGTGKSTLLLNLITQDIAAGRGCAVLDPKGDLVRDLLGRIPRRRIRDVVYLGPDEGSRAVGINPLELGPTDDPHLVAENVLSIFKRIYADNWGPRTDDVLKACLLTLVAVPGATLAHITALLGDPALRRRLTAPLADDVGVGGFWHWYEKISEARRTEATAPLQNKLRDFLIRPRLRYLLCQRSTVDLRSLMDEGGILLADLGVGRWGESASALAGSFLVSRLWQAALSRQAQHEEQRRDFLLYIDEFHSFLGIGGPFADALAQARGLRLSLTIANQHLGQLPREIRDAVSANARSKVVFRCGAGEAATLAADLAPFDAETLIGLRAFEAAVRLPSMTGATTVRTLPPTPPPTDATEASEVVAASA
ncbi:MAG: type IV secretory system conjugative DNA transfer family protein, partial [Candidatus Limnocylindria bacterium]